MKRLFTSRKARNQAAINAAVAHEVAKLEARMFANETRRLKQLIAAIDSDLTLTAAQRTGLFAAVREWLEVDASV